MSYTQRKGKIAEISFGEEKSVLVKEKRSKMSKADNKSRDALEFVILETFIYHRLDKEAEKCQVGRFSDLLLFTLHPTK
ncbi:CLUMA_CG007025, isoform A [Clunio marinus]|uniref:CLUMA_CG007025, isoform A n=1 Tax=Clunio marinus TaxID=568069 RepID=A0A1J1I536_9DIPT|nr:CLUMA_CG007025, isoform A [Clunio marinus]